MKRKMEYMLAGAMAVVVALSSTGCSTTRQERSAQAATKMAELRDLLDQGEKQIDAVQKAVTDLHRADASHLRKAYDRFDSEAEKMRNIAGKVKATYSAMKKQSDAYFKEWEAELGEIHNRDLSKLAQERRTLLKQHYQSIQDATRQLKNSYAAYDRDIADMQRFLGNDLTRAGSSMATPYLERLAAEAAAVKAATADTRERVAMLARIMAPE